MAFNDSGTKSYGARGLMRTATYPTAAAQTFLAGDFVCFNSSGQVVQAVAAGSDVGAVSGITNAIVGRALENAINDLGVLKTSVAVMIAEPGTEFLMPLYSATPTNAVPVPSLIGVAYELRNASTPFTGYCVNLDATTNTKVRIVDFDGDSYATWPNTSTAGTTQYADAWVVFIPSSTLVGAH